MGGKLEVLVAAVEQDGEKLYDKMQISTNAVIANQSDTYAYDEKTIRGKKVKIVQTADRGVGKNRNIALLNAEAEYLLFSDEDIIYRKNYEKMIIQSFERHPDADLLIFDLNYLNPPEDFNVKRIKREKRGRFFNIMRYGTPRIAIKRDSLQKANVWFSLLYGGGAAYACGEDSLFLREVLKKGLHVYIIPHIIADLDSKKSSWFHGYDDKFFRDKGVLAANIFPVFCHIYIISLSWKLRKKTKDYSFNRIYHLLRKGIKMYKNSVKKSTGKAW